MHAAQVCCAKWSIWSITTLGGVNGRLLLAAVTVGSFLLLLTRVNTMRCTRARRCPAARIGIITSVNRALPVTSWNRRLKSRSSKDSGTTTESHTASASLVSTHAARWSVSIMTASKSADRASTAARRRCATGHHCSPLRVHSGASLSSGLGCAAPVVSSDHDTAPAEGTRYRLGGMAGLKSAGRIRYLLRSTWAGAAAARGGFLEKNAPKMLLPPAAAGGLAAAVASTSIACSRSRIRPSARVSSVVFSTVTCRPFMGAPNPSRADPPRSNAVMSLYREKSNTSTFLSGRARAASHAVWNAMNVLPTPPRLLQKHTECEGAIVAVGVNAAAAAADAVVVSELLVLLCRNAR
mmetsp:Transcript_34712/g.84982  ORF Transcript_34712/g.84982 Transcript_34712/m.84982 type:complete len:352 (+) Transcript_34712:787-1842(+)